MNSIRGKYTLNPSMEIEKTIEEHLVIIGERIKSIMKPDLLILGGSFGKGEGTVIKRDGKLKFFSDYEISVVTPNLKNRKLCMSLSEELTKELGVSVTINVVKPSRLIFNQKRNLSFGTYIPNIVMYELKEGSKVLHGDGSLLKVNPINPEKIPLFDGLVLLFNRMVEVLIYNGDYSFVKTGIAVGDTLLISKGMYHFSYFERMKRLERMKSVGVENLSGEQISLLIEFYKVKLFPDKFNFEREKTQQLAEIVEKTIRFVAFSYLQFKFDNFTDFILKYMGNPRVKRLYPFYLLGPWRIPLYENFIYTLKHLQWKMSIPSIFLRNPFIPWQHVIYSIVPYMFFKKLGKIEGGEDRIKEIFGEDIDEKKLIILWKTVCYGKKPL
jgi:hypothetical protein